MFTFSEFFFAQMTVNYHPLPGDLFRQFKVQGRNKVHASPLGLGLEQQFVNIPPSF
tara:strand:- start:2103 stop:2270 length:168 start_codon:yes stop_codon:yes gene_type:complete